MRNRSRTDGSLAIKAGQSKEIQGRESKPPKRQKGNDECAKRDLKKAGVLCRNTVWGRTKAFHTFCSEVIAYLRDNSKQKRETFLSFLLQGRLPDPAWPSYGA